MITQEHIAKKLNISLSTVSRSLKGSPVISSQTRNAVNQMAQQLGYKPRKYETGKEVGGYANTTKQTGKSVGVLVNANSANHLYMNDLSLMMEGVSLATKQLGLLMTCHYLSSENEALSLCSKENYLPMMRDKELLGLIYMWPFPSQVIGSLSSVFPSISINHRYEGLSIPVVTSCQEEGIEVIVKHLYGLGHRKIAFLGPEDPNELLYPRFAGYLSGLSQNNIVIDMSLVINVLDVEYKTFQYGEKVIELMEKKGVTAVVAASGICGNALLDQLESKGISIPEAMSIAGYDGLARNDNIRLSGVESPHKIMGFKAVSELLNANRNTYDAETNHNPIIEFSNVFVEGNTIGAI